MARKLRSLATQAIAEARNVQSRLTGGEIQHSHMMIQTGFGWTVRACHVGAEEPSVFLNGITPKLDKLVQSPRGTNRMRMRRRQHEAMADASRSHARKFTALRDRLRQVAPDEDDDVGFD